MSTELKVSGSSHTPSRFWFPSATHLFLNGHLEYNSGGSVTRKEAPIPPHHALAQNGTSPQKGGSFPSHLTMPWLRMVPLPRKVEAPIPPHHALAQNGTSPQKGGSSHPTSPCLGSEWYLSPERCSRRLLLLSSVSV